MNGFKQFVFVVVLLIFKNASTYGQYDPIYSHYMFNIQAHNPAYAGSWNSLGFTIIDREQWMGFENHPSTQSLSLQTPLRNGKIGTGFCLINDDNGAENRKSIFVDYSFKIKVNPQISLRLGLKGGITSYTNNLSSYELIEQDDDAFLEDVEQLILPNFGVGAFLSSPKFYVGFSVPKMIQNEVADYSNKIDIRSVNLIGGWVIGVCKGIDIKPSFSIKYFTSSYLVTDLNVSFLFADRFWLGAMVRTTNDLNFGFNTNFLISDKLRIGYAYDLFNNTALSSFTNGTHEILISYEFHIEKTHFVSPRYF